MKRLLLGFCFLISVLACDISHATSIQNTWLAVYSSNCPAITNQPAYTQCFENDGPVYVCSPNGGLTSQCNSSSEWKIVTGVWVDSGITLTLKYPRNVNIGTGLLMGDPTLGLTLNPSGDGQTNVNFLPTGLFVTNAGIQYIGNDAFWNVNRTTDKTNPNTGDVWFNTSILQWIYYNGTALKRFPVYQIYANTFASPTSSTNKMLLQAPVGLKIEAISCIVDSGTVPITVQQCNSSGGSCSNINSSITCSTTGANDAGGISTPNITSGNYVNLNIGTTSGSPTSLNITVTYSQNEP